MKRTVLLLLIIFTLGCNIPGPESAANENDAVATTDALAVAVEAEETASEEAVVEEVASIEVEPIPHNMDEALLAEIPAYVDASLPDLHSVIVMRYGEIVYEEYFGSGGADVAKPIYSVTKSILSTLIGIAIDDGAIGSVDQTVGDYLGDQITSSDPRMAEISIFNLLTMHSGIFCQGDSCFDNSLERTLGNELQADPGAGFVYDTGSTHLLSGILQEAVGVSAETFAEERLFAPLGIDDVSWRSDRAGVSYGGFSINMSPRDMAKFGQLMLQEGSWNGEQLVSAEYIRAATSDQVGTGSEWAQYGYLWWLPNDLVPFGYQAIGYGGQYVHVVPDFDLVVVVTGRGAAGADNQNFSIISNYVVPAVLE